MPSFELNRMQSITGVSPTSAADHTKARPTSEGRGSIADRAVAGSADGTGIAVEIAAPAQNGPPVDNDRVAEIRSALRDGSYPLVPAKIADAMIAAQLKFEIAE
ncbi:MAG: flagellar biosynthesis anti-sigma factor FlgM [Pseudomonadota bacterium]